ncbi:sigma-70 family RNA polymerase sigma factor [uncultured Thermanaerothrix sp.]|uniref:RNA polymerase sigma factor n=1 Tax=uncultured Thermanaerothrix sp. TaxID=1195149 RepID=UPI00261AC7C5|nr:sigma-70 family RNA polymerase sigma factor [uncultured Thermanaerothrix sp.]
MIAEPDSALLRHAQQDIEAFSQVVVTYQTPVFNLCYRMLGDSQEAEDAAQETFWRAFRSLHRYDPSRSFLTWLLSIAAHYCIDQLRKRRTPVESIQEWTDELLPGSAPNPEAQYVQYEEHQRIQRLLMRLEPHERAVLILRYWYEMSELEMAEILSISTSAVKSRLHRARQKMAILWKEEQHSGSAPKESIHEAPAY